MCYTCSLLDGLFPTPKELARAYAEQYTAVSAEHDTVILAKLLKSLEENGLSSEEQLKYVQDTNEEMNNIIDLLGKPTSGPAN